METEPKTRTNGNQPETKVKLQAERPRLFKTFHWLIDNAMGLKAVRSKSKAQMLYNYCREKLELNNPVKLPTTGGIARALEWSLYTPPGGRRQAINSSVSHYMDKLHDVGMIVKQSSRPFIISIPPGGFKPDCPQDIEGPPSDEYVGEDEFVDAAGQRHFISDFDVKRQNARLWHERLGIALSVIAEICPEEDEVIGKLTYAQGVANKLQERPK